MRWRNFLLALCAAVVLGSCGGGGGGGVTSGGTSTGNPLVWDSAAAAWDSVDWQ
jgi:hypothetical protein